MDLRHDTLLAALGLINFTSVALPVQASPSDASELAALEFLSAGDLGAKSGFLRRMKTIQIHILLVLGGVLMAEDGG